MSGEVKIDGTNVQDFRIQSLRQQISFVLQETLRFRAPVGEIIAYGRPAANRSGSMPVPRRKLSPVRPKLGALPMVLIPARRSQNVMPNVAE